MTVAELIAKLNELPGELPVFLSFETEDGHPYCHVASVSTEKLLTFPHYEPGEPACFIEGGERA